MRKLVSTILVFVLLLTLAAPTALAAAEPNLVDDTPQVLASTQQNLIIYLCAVAVVSVGLIVLMIVKKKALEDQH